MPEPKAPVARLSFLYLMCNDVAAMKRFYGDLLAMRVGGFVDTPAFGYLVLNCEGFQAMFFRADSRIAPATAFASQPGWQGGILETTSWAVQVPEADFAATVARLGAAGVKCHFGKPAWFQDSYWGFPVLDPMGNTVEVFATPATRPTSTTWPD